MNNIKHLGQAISALNSIIETKQNELINYKTDPKASAKAVFFKQAEINNLTGILTAFNDTLIDIENDLKALQKQVNKEKQTVLKLEACLLFHRVPPPIIEKFKNQNFNLIIDRLKIIYNNDKPPEPKKTDRPLIPFNLLKEKAQTGTTTNKNFKIELNKANL